MSSKRTADRFVPEKNDALPASHTQTVLGVAMAVILLMTVGITFYHSLFQFSESARLQEESYLTQLYMERYFSNLKDMETGQRGFILTGKQDYLAPYEKGRLQLENDWANLLKHQVATGDKAEKIKRLRILTDQKSAEVAKGLSIYRSDGQAAAIQSINSDLGKEWMDQIRALINNISEQEGRELKVRAGILQRNMRNTLVVAAVMGLIGLSLFIYIIVLLIREANMRARLNNKLEMEIQERKQANERLEREAEERERAKTRIDGLNKTLEAKVHTLDALNKELEAFSYSVSHDLRAPLRSIDGFSLALLNKCSDQLDANGKDYLNRVRANSQRMAQLIDDMLQLSRLTRGEMNLSEVNLSQLAEEIINENRRQEPDRNVQAIIQPDLVVQADKRLMNAVLENLLNNAWKFTSQHETARIEFGSFLRDNKPVYFVRDDGAGFEMEYVDKLFGAFQRLHAMNEFPGTGIGLATVQRIIHRHGGKTWAEGEPEKGATFYFTLNTEILE